MCHSQLRGVKMKKKYFIAVSALFIAIIILYAFYYYRGTPQIASNPSGTLNILSQLEEGETYTGEIPYALEKDTSEAQNPISLQLNKMKTSIFTLNLTATIKNNSGQEVSYTDYGIQVYQGEQWYSIEGPIRDNGEEILHVIDSGDSLELEYNLKKFSVHKGRYRIVIGIGTDEYSIFYTRKFDAI